MKKGIIGICLLAIVAGMGVSSAADGDLEVDVAVTWVSKYIWRGIDLLDDKAATQPSVNFGLWDTGFYANVWASYAGASKNGGSISTVDATEYDYTVGYANTAYDGEVYQMDYTVNWVYYDFINQPSKNADAQEINVGAAFPNICPWGVVPSYTAIKMWSDTSGNPSNDLSGWIHYIRLDYGLALPGFIENNPEQVLNFYWDITYNGGAAVPGFFDDGGVLQEPNIDHDWSHTTFGVFTDVAVPGIGGTFTPGIYYQISMDDSVNTEDELWTGLSYTLSF